MEQRIAWGKETMTRDPRRLCDQVRQLAENIRKDFRRRASDTPAKVAALFMFARGYKSYQAALLLCRKGFGQDAASVARTLLELSLQVRSLTRRFAPPSPAGARD